MKLPQDPIFIVGYPRSGTTLLQRLLVTQPGIFSFPETHYFCVVEKQLKYDPAGNILLSCMENVFEKVHEKIGFHFTPEERNTLNRMTRENRLSSKELFEFIIARFLEKTIPGADRNQPYRWLEKTPNHAHFLDRIIEFYPCAQVLHIIRHPVPAVFSRKLKFPFNKETPIAELARRWDRLQRDVENFKKTHPASIHTLRYEDLVENMNNELAAAADFLHIPFDFELISGLKNQGTADSFILPSEPWKSEDVNREMVNTNDGYKENISGEDARIIEEITMEIMTKYGYTSYYK